MPNMINGSRKARPKKNVQLYHQSFEQGGEFFLAWNNQTRHNIYIMQRIAIKLVQKLNRRRIECNYIIGDFVYDALMLLPDFRIRTSDASGRCVGITITCFCTLVFFSAIVLLVPQERFLPLQIGSIFNPFGGKVFRTDATKNLRGPKGLEKFANSDWSKSFRPIRTVQIWSEDMSGTPRFYGKKCIVNGCKIVQMAGNGVTMRGFPWGNDRPA